MVAIRLCLIYNQGFAAILFLLDDSYMEFFFKIAETCSIHKIYGLEQSFIINQINGCWCVLDDKYISFISALIGKTICSNDLHLDNELFSLLRKLFFQGILEINNKTYLIEKPAEEVDHSLTIVVNTTNRCNIHCKYCYASTNIDRNETFSTASIVDDITRLAGDKENRDISIVFHGGEPLLCWNDIAEMVVKLNSKFRNISYSIQTNGILINKEIIDFIKTHNFKIGISLDGYDKQTNINRFGEDKKDCLKKVLLNINELIFNDIKIGVLSVITDKNYKELLNSVIFFVEKGVKYFGFNFFLSKGRGADNKTEIPIHELVKIYEKLARYINDYNAKHELKDYISERTVSVLIYSLSHKPLGACFSTPCSAGENLYAIDVNGDVYLCDEFIGDSNFCIGNIRDSKFSTNDIRNDNYTNLRCRSNDSIEKCKECPVSKVCPFKCPSDSFYRTGDLFKPHSMCEFTQLIISKYMYLLQSNIINSKHFIFN